MTKTGGDWQFLRPGPYTVLTYPLRVKRGIEVDTIKEIHSPKWSCWWHWTWVPFLCLSYFDSWLCFWAHHVIRSNSNSWSKREGEIMWVHTKGEKMNFADLWEEKSLGNHEVCCLHFTNKEMQAKRTTRFPLVTCLLTLTATATSSSHRPQWSLKVGEVYTEVIYFLRSPN